MKPLPPMMLMGIGCQSGACAWVRPVSVAVSARFERLRRRVGWRRRPWWRGLSARWVRA